jgi:hypothetical protein
MKYCITTLLFAIVTTLCIAQKPKTAVKAPVKPIVKTNTKLPPKTISKTVAKPTKLTKAIKYTEKPEPIIIYKATEKDSIYVKKVASEMCGCMKPVFDSLNPVAITLLNETITIGEKNADANFKKTVAKLKLEDQTKLMASIATLQQLNVKGKAVNNCLQLVDYKYKNIDLSINTTKEEVYDKLLLTYLKLDCNTASLFIKASIKK